MTAENSHFELTQQARKKGMSQSETQVNGGHTASFTETRKLFREARPQRTTLVLRQDAAFLKNCRAPLQLPGRYGTFARRKSLHFFYFFFFFWFFFFFFFFLSFFYFPRNECVGAHRPGPSATFPAGRRLWVFFQLEMTNPTCSTTLCPARVVHQRNPWLKLAARKPNAEWKESGNEERAGLVPYLCTLHSCHSLNLLPFETYGEQ